jgi:hypothetical protein
MLYSAAVGVQALPNETTCKGFNVPLSKLSTGSLAIKVTYKDGSTVANTSKTVEVN